MEAIKLKLFTNWHLMRIMRAVFGVWLAFPAIQERDWMIGAVSFFFLYQAATDTGCCSTAGCSNGSCGAPTGKQSGSGTTDIDFEEIK